jgi:hypothetical protein
MNKTQRKALIDNLTDVTLNTADDYIRHAIVLADAAQHGRTDRWKEACTLAGRRILISERDQLTVEACRRKVLQGLEAMTDANK